MSEEKTSKLIDNRIDLKALTINALQTTFDTINSGTIEGLEVTDKLQIVLITNFGYVTGEYVNLAEAAELPENGSGFNKFMYATTVKSRNQLLADLEEKNDDLKLVSDSSLIYLKNATIKPFANPNATFTFGDFFLFTDQVVGLSGKGASE